MPVESRKFKLGKSNVLLIILIGWFLLGIGILLYVKGTITALLLIPPGLVLLFSFSGIHYDPENRRFKEYTWIGFVEFGEWEPIDLYRDILVLRKTNSFQSLSSDGIANYTSKASTYEIYFANETHFDRQLICRIDDKEKAYQTAFQIAKDVEFDVVSFNPGRRNRRRVISTVPV